MIIENRVINYIKKIMLFDIGEDWRIGGFVFGIIFVFSVFELFCFFIIYVLFIFVMFLVCI